jgi:hypothetical protein
VTVGVSESDSLTPSSVSGGFSVTVGRTKIFRSSGPETVTIIGGGNAVSASTVFAALLDELSAISIASFDESLPQAVREITSNRSAIGPITANRENLGIDPRIG